ncbi:hypothetical protein JCM17478_23850 [Thermopirellula anaerolimosa]
MPWCFGKRYPARVECSGKETVRDGYRTSKQPVRSKKVADVVQELPRIDNVLEYVKCGDNVEGLFSKVIDCVRRGTLNCLHAIGSDSFYCACIAIDTHSSPTDFRETPQMRAIAASNVQNTTRSALRRRLREHPAAMSRQHSIINDKMGEGTAQSCWR